MDEKNIQKETRKFKMHEGLIHTIIYKQARTLDKSIMELVMNSIDAGATKVDITVDVPKNKFIIKDNGKGFQTDDEIDNFFEMLGTPHRSGDSQFGYNISWIAISSLLRFCVPTLVLA